MKYFVGIIALTFLISGCTTAAKHLGTTFSVNGIPLAKTASPCDFTVTIPASGSILASGAPVYVTIQATQPSTNGNNWINYYVNAPSAAQTWKASGPIASGSVSLGRLVAGLWTITATEYAPDGSQVCSRSVPVATADPALAIGPMIPGITGSAASLSGNPNRDPATFGIYSDAASAQWGGIPAIGGPLLTDVQAAQQVVATPKSAVEISAQCQASTAPDAIPCPRGGANVAANGYYENFAVPNPNNYLPQLNAFHNSWKASALGGAIGRIDGACPLINPTTAEVLQWAANKWGLNPLLLYAEATQEGQWDQLSLGDVANGIGTSSGIVQVGDRNTADRPDHAPPGFTGVSANLARQNTCFNADFYGAQLWAVYNGQLGAGPVTPSQDIGAAIQAWFQGMWGTTAAGDYSQQVATHLTQRDWLAYFQGQQVAY